MYKLICIKDVYNYYRNDIFIKKGQIISYDGKSGEKILILKRKNQEYFGFFEIKYFMTLDEWRQKQINRILNGS